MLKIKAALAMIVGAVITILTCVNIWCLVRVGAITDQCQSVGGIWAFQFFFFGFLPIALILFFKKWWWEIPTNKMLIYAFFIGVAFGVLYPASGLLHVYLINNYDVNVGRIVFNLFPLLLVLLAVVSPMRYFAYKNS